MSSVSSVRPGTPTQANVIFGQKMLLQRRVNSGANWFMWIAGLSLVNSVSRFAGSGFHFVIGLGLTQVIDQLAGSINAVVLVLDVIAAGIFVGFGLLARQRRDWAFIVGMILYGLDALLFVLVKDVVSIGFHLFALFYIYRGLKANEALAKLGAPAHA